MYFVQIVLIYRPIYILFEKQSGSFRLSKVKRTDWGVIHARVNTADQVT